MLSRLRRRPRRSRGAALLEMVVVFLVLFYLVMGGVEFGWFMYAKHVVQSAARDGARAGIIGTSSHAQANAAISETMSAGGFQSIGYTTTYQRINVNTGGAIVVTNVTDISTVPRGEGLRVTISAPFSAFRVRPLGVIPATKQVTGVTTMVKE
jgi:Flp pilus assembly protein TadG